MNPIKYLQENGVKRAMKVLYDYKLELLLEKIVFVFTKHKNLNDVIMIESHNDFDCNGGAFYNYLIKNGYNKKYKLLGWFEKKRNLSFLRTLKLCRYMVRV